MTTLSSRISKRLIKEVTLKELNEYFDKKGYKDSKDALLYPPVIADIDLNILQLSNKIELIPFTEELDPTTGVIKIGWNLFVLGQNRLFLGYTTHSELSELKQSLQSGRDYDSSLSDPTRTVQEVIDFIIETLSKSKRGFEKYPKNTRAKSPIIPTNKPRIGPSASGGYYEKNRPV